MKITSSYDVQIVGMNKIFEPTVNVYREALAFLIDIFNIESDEIFKIDDAKKRFNYAEHLVHSTSENAAKYTSFDEKFYKLPSYLRRDAIQSALGVISSYRTNYERWIKDGMSGNPPVLQSKHNSFPVFYRDNMYKMSDKPNMVMLKLYIKNDWVWYPIKLRVTDIKYIRKYWTGAKVSAPVLEKRYKKYYLSFAFTEDVKLNKTPPEKQKILAIDLGVNTDAACSIMKPDGTVLDRKFIDFPSEKDHLYHSLNKIKKLQRERKSVTSLWRYARDCNTQHAIKVSSAIIEYAAVNNVDCIVFEYLDTRGRRTKSQKISMWKKDTIQNMVEHKAHRCGMHVSRVNARNTSALAFDGSGKLKRDEINHSLCTFISGKRYNCDLSASYNIGARYFVRELLKPLSATVRSELEAKVPSIKKRTETTLSTLIKMNAELCGFAA